MKVKEVLEIWLDSKIFYGSIDNYRLYKTNCNIMFGVFEDDYKYRLDIINGESIKIDKCFCNKESVAYEHYYHKQIREFNKLLEAKLKI